MPNRPITNKTGGHLVKLILLGFAVQLAVILYVFVTAYNGRVETVKAQRAGCERGKLDRIDNASFQRAHRKYIKRVVLAKSVEEDVKKAAREAVQTYNKTAADLTNRSRIRCAKAYPEARLLP